MTGAERRGLSPDEQAFVDEAIAKVVAQDPDNAARYRSYVDLHVAINRGHGVPLTKADMFSRAAIRSSVRQARRLYATTSPYKSSVERVASSVNPRLGQPLELTSEAHLAPYSADERTFVHTLASVSGEDGWSMRAAVALGEGWGIVDEPAGQVTAAHPVRVAPGVLAILDPATGAWRAARGRPVAELEACAAHRPTGPLTDLYTPAGRTRFRRSIQRSRTSFSFNIDRLRATWIVRLLNAGVPAGACAEIVGIRMFSLAKYLPYTWAPEPEMTRIWMGSERTAAPTVSAALFDRLAPRRPRAVPPPDWDDNSYLPISPEAAEAWSSGLGDHLQGLVAGLRPSQRRNLLSAAGVMLAWAARRPDINTLERLLDPFTIELWIAEAARSGDAHKTLLDYRSRVRKLAKLAGTVPDERSGTVDDAAAPYDDATIDRLLRYTSLTTKADGVRKALLTLGLGAGGRPEESVRARGSSVHVRGPTTEIALTGAHARAVPFAPAYAPQARALGRSAGDGYLTGLATDRIDHHLKAISRALDEPFRPARLRARWAADQLARGVPFPTFAAAYGVKYPEVDHFRTYLPHWSAAELTAWSAEPLT